MERYIQAEGQVSESPGGGPMTGKGHRRIKLGFVDSYFIDQEVKGGKSGYWPTKRYGCNVLPQPKTDIRLFCTFVSISHALTYCYHKADVQGLCYYPKSPITGNYSCFPIINNRVSEPQVTDLLCINRYI